MKILILGGNRFFGRHLTDSLLGAKHEITLLNRGQVPDGFGDKIERLRADRQRPQELVKALSDRHFDLVFDQVCYSASEAKAACDLFRGRTRRYVVTSSESVFDAGAAQPESGFDPRTYRWTSEADPKQNYQEAKRQVEQVFMQARGFSVAIVRPSLVVGLDDYTKRLTWHLDRLRRGQEMFFPDLKVKIDFIRSDQAGMALKVIGLANVEGPVNCTAPGAVRLEDLLRMVESAVGHKAVLASAASSENSSPYGFDQEKTMDTSLLQSLGFHVDASPIWIRELVEQSAHGA